MPFISLTRLRIRSIRFLPFFALYAQRSILQIKRAPGFLTGALLPDKDWTFWTMTAWDSEESMRKFMTSGAHKAAMPRLIGWCDEASVAHWCEPNVSHSAETVLPSWREADKRMRETGRASKVKHPSANHARLTYAVPRTTRSAPITRG